MKTSISVIRDGLRFLKLLFSFKGLPIVFKGQFSDFLFFELDIVRLSLMFAYHVFELISDGSLFIFIDDALHKIQEILPIPFIEVLVKLLNFASQNVEMLCYRPWSQNKFLQKF